ncbi:MAG: hypothetical protein ACRDRP_04575 [Pseudonocardiaceae bacterium]
MSAKPKDAAWVLRMGRHGVQILAVVLVLALVFTMVNVQQFAAQGHPQFGVQWWIAWLLDPMASLTMAAAIVFEGLLADYGKPKVQWLTITKWYAGLATWGMNIWASAATQSFAGIWLHSVAPGLVLGLAEAAPRVRRHMAAIIEDLERAAAPAPVHPAAPVAIDLPAPTYQRVVAPSSWVSPPTPVVAPQPIVIPGPVPEPDAEQVAPVIVAAAPVVPVNVDEPTSTEPVTPVDRHGGDQVQAYESVVTPPAPEPQRAPGEVTPAPSPGPPGTDLDALIARILDEADDPTIGRRRITDLLPDPKPTDHAVKTALARVRAGRQPVLNGAGMPAERESTGGSGDG